MSDSKGLRVLDGLLRDYADGLYLPGEVTSESLRLLVAEGEEGREGLWLALPEWTRKGVLEVLSRASTADDVESIKRVESPGFKSGVFELKSWLVARGEM